MLSPYQGDLMDVALIGLSLPGVQNHSLAVLEHVLATRGHAVDRIGFNGWPDLDPVLARIHARRPALVGISIQSTESAVPSAALAWFLRHHGFGGRIVAGGHFATLNAEALLDSRAGFDAVIRFAGEEALPALCDSGFEPERLARVPGLLWRAPTGDVLRGAAPLPVDPRAVGPRVFAGRSSSAAPGELAQLPRHLGFPAADLVESRGCEARCAYCCIAGASERAERELGVRYARRDEQEIAATISALYHRQGARVFTVMDDNLLPLEPTEAAAFLRRLRRALVSERVDEKQLALSLQIRADAVTDEVADELAALGVVRAYVGIDGYSAPMLRALGRKAPASAGVDAVARLAARGVLSVCNALLLGPTVAFETLLEEIEGLARLRHAPVHLLPIDVREGTRYAERASALGLVEGGFLHRHTRFLDERTALLGRLLTSLPSRLHERSVPIALYDLAYNSGIARRLVPSARIDSALETFASVTAAWNASQIEVLRSCAAIAARLDEAAADAWLASEQPVLSAFDTALRDACDEALAQIERAVSSVLARPAPAHARGRLLSQVALAFGLAACSTDPVLDVRDGGSGSDLHVPATTDGGGDLGGGGDLRDAGMEPDLGRRGPLDPDRLEFWDCTCGADQVQLQLDGSGCIVAIRRGDGTALPAMTVECLRDLFGTYCYPSLAGKTVTATPHCWIA